MTQFRNSVCSAANASRQPLVSLSHTPLAHLTKVFLWVAVVVGILWCGGLTSSNAHGQSSLGSGGESSDLSRPQSTMVGFFDLLESAGAAFMAIFQDDSDPAEQWNSYQSPRHALMTFVVTMEAVVQGKKTADWGVAEPLLGAIPPSQRRSTAEDLLYIFDRLPQLSPSSLPGPELVRETGITRFEFFPRGLPNKFLYGALSKAPAGRIELELQNGQWLFTSTTLEGAKELLDSIDTIPPRPRSKREGQVFFNVVVPTFSESSPWSWLFFLLVIVGAGLISHLSWKLLSAAANRIESIGDFAVAPLLRGLRIPLTLFIAIVGLSIGSSKLHMEPGLSSYRWTVLEVLFVVAIVWLIVAFLELLTVTLQKGVTDEEDDPYAQMLSTVVRRILRLFAITVILIFVLQNVFSWNVTALLGGFGVLALGISLAAQDAIKNLFGAITIFANRPFVRNDWIRFEGYIGVVEDVSVQITRVRLLTGEVLSIPNMKFIDSVVENLSKRRYLRRVMNLFLPLETESENISRAIDTIKEVLRTEEVCHDNQQNLELKPPLVNCDDIIDGAIKLRIDYWYQMDKDDENQLQRDSERGYLTYLAHKTVVNKAILKGLTDLNIRLAHEGHDLFFSNARGCLPV